MAVAAARHNGIVTPLTPDTLMKNYGCGQCGEYKYLICMLNCGIAWRKDSVDVSRSMKAYTKCRRVMLNHKTVQIHLPHRLRIFFERVEFEYYSFGRLKTQYIDLLFNCLKYTT